MKIQGSKPPGGEDINNVKVQKPDKNQASEKANLAGKQAGTKDKVSLSGRAKEISDLNNLLNQLPEIRTEKVEAIKKAIEAGAYNVDSLKVAEKILEEI